MFLCQNCGVIHHRDPTGPHVVPYEIAESISGPEGQRSYMPFWRLQCLVTIRSRDVQGGVLHKLASSFKEGQNGGILQVYIPASKLDPTTFRQLAVGLTTSPPRYVLRKDFRGIERVPTIMDLDEAKEMADFVVVTLEAEQPGTLQYLNYELTVQDSKLVYLPMVNGPSGPRLAL
jgi:hypothetical protein